MASTLGFTNLIDDLRQQFDLIIFDSPSAIGSTDAIALAAASDGVVLVVEAEKTRRQVVQEIKTRMEKAGGNILGVILNKRRNYIPRFIYRRL